MGASSIEQYIRKAENFKINLKGATKSYVDGAVDGVIRYKKNGKFIGSYLLENTSLEVLHGRLEENKY